MLIKRRPKLSALNLLVANLYSAVPFAAFSLTFAQYTCRPISQKVERIRPRRYRHKPPKVKDELLPLLRSAGKVTNGSLNPIAAAFIPLDSVNLAGRNLSPIRQQVDQ